MAEGGTSDAGVCAHFLGAGGGPSAALGAPVVVTASCVGLVPSPLEPVRFSFHLALPV